MFVKKLFCVGLLLLGIGTLLYGALPTYHAYQSLSWDSVPGVVTQSQLAYGKGVTRVKKGTRSGRYYAQIEYEYSVSDTPFKNDQLAFGYRGHKGSQEAKVLLGQYPANARVPVYFAPSDPKRSVLRPGFDSSILFYPGVGLAVIVVSILGLRALQQKPRN